jgi:hypothetical protein
MELMVHNECSSSRLQEIGTAQEKCYALSEAKYEEIIHDNGDPPRCGDHGNSILDQF